MVVMHVRAVALVLWAPCVLSASLVAEIVGNLARASLNPCTFAGPPKIVIWSAFSPCIVPESADTMPSMACRAWAIWLAVCAIAGFLHSFVLLVGFSVVSVLCGLEKDYF